jgi:hypothetical protein
MTDRLRTEAERVAAAAQPPAVREPWLTYNEALIGVLNRLRLNDEEIKKLLHAVNANNATAIATGLHEYAAGDDIHREAQAARLTAQIEDLRGELMALAERRTQDLASLSEQIEQYHKVVLGELAKVYGRQARQARRDSAATKGDAK